MSTTARLGRAAAEEMVVATKATALVAEEVVVVALVVERRTSKVRGVEEEEVVEVGKTRREAAEAVAAGYERLRQNRCARGRWRWRRLVAAGGGRVGRRQRLGRCGGMVEGVGDQCRGWCRWVVKNP